MQRHNINKAKIKWINCVRDHKVRRTQVWQELRLARRALFRAVLRTPRNNMPEPATPKPTAAELKIYRADFESQTDGGFLTRDKLGTVLERLLKRATSEIELRVNCCAG